MAAFIAEHNLPFTISDHLVKLIANICDDSTVAQGMTCGRTKATGIVKNVIGNENHEILCENLRKKIFSIIIDESTDLGSLKHLCIIVRFYSDQKNKVVDHFFDLIELSNADATSIYNAIINKFEQHSIPYKDNLKGFASDGANVMMGAHHSVMALLKKDIPHLFILKCICHSFHLAASYACQKLPRFVEDVTRDIYNYFGSSPKRQREFEAFQQFCEVKMHKILHPSQTRWLSVHMVVNRILEQYHALKLYFTDAVSEHDILAAENILAKLNDITTKIFLQFLDFILPVINNLNKEMQSETPKIHLLYKNICTTLRTIYDCFLKRPYLVNTNIQDIDFQNPRNFLTLEDCYYGAAVNKTIIENEIPPEKLDFFRKRALEFYIEACSQILKRFPLKNNNLELLNFLEPSVVKNGSISSLSPVVIKFEFLVNSANLQELDMQWRMLRNMQELNSLPDDVESFWKEIRKITAGDGTETFEELSNFAFNILCLPHSSANVERIFSKVNLIKSKQRNALNTETLNGLLHCKEIVEIQNCYDFVIRESMLSKMNKYSIYK